MTTVQPVRLAYACSGDEESWRQMVLKAPIIAEGWVDKITLRPDLPNSPYIPVEVSLQVERLVKGSAPPHIVFIDSASVLPGQGGQPLRRPDGTLQFNGGAGACGILDEDVTGKYALIVFLEGNGQTLRVNRLAAAFGDGPQADAIIRLRQAVLAVGQPISLPSTGDGGLLGDNGKRIPPLETLAFGAVLLALAVGKLVRLRSH